MFVPTVIELTRIGCIVDQLLPTGHRQAAIFISTKTQ